MHSLLSSRQKEAFVSLAVRAHTAFFSWFCHDKQGAPTGEGIVLVVFSRPYQLNAALPGNASIQLIFGVGCKAYGNEVRLFKLLLTLCLAGDHPISLAARRTRYLPKLVVGRLKNKELKITGTFPYSWTSDLLQKLGQFSCDHGHVRSTNLKSRKHSLHNFYGQRRIL